jgi:hypothetical protein
MKVNPLNKDNSRVKLDFDKLTRYAAITLVFLSVYYFFIKLLFL